jgi:hypothetical protein
MQLYTVHIQVLILALRHLQFLILLQAHNISSPPARTASFGGASGGGNERSGSGGVARRAADAITNLAHENLEIKNMVRNACVTQLLRYCSDLQQLLALATCAGTAAAAS